MLLLPFCILGTGSIFLTTNTSYLQIEADLGFRRTVFRLPVDRVLGLEEGRFRVR